MLLETIGSGLARLQKKDSPVSLGLNMSAGIGGPVIGIHVRPLPFGQKSRHHHLRHEGMETADVLPQLIPQWWGRNFIEGVVVVMSRMTLARFPCSSRSRRTGMFRYLAPSRYYAPRRFIKTSCGRFPVPLCGGVWVRAPGQLSPSSTEGGHAVIKGAHVLIVMPLLVSNLGVDPIVCLLQGVLYLGFIFLKGDLQRILDLDLGLLQDSFDSFYALFDDPLEGFDHGWVHCCEENANVVLGLVLPGPHGGRQNVLTRLEYESSLVFASASESAFCVWSEGRSTSRRLSDAQINKSVLGMYEKME